MQPVNGWVAPSRLAWVWVFGLLLAGVGLVPLRVAAAVVAVGLLAGWWWQTPGFGLAMDPRVWRALQVASLVWLEAVGLSGFFGLRLNGVEFSVFDWALESTHHGRLGYTPLGDLNHFGVHGSFILLLWVPLHELWDSPLWLVVSAGLVVWLGLFPLRRLVRLSNGGPHGALELAAAVAWLANPWTGSALQAGFRPELLFPLLTLWVLVGWIERNGEILWLAGLALLATREDAALVLMAFVIGGTIVERWRWPTALGVSVVSAGWLVLFGAVLQPRLLGRGAPAFWTEWSDFGATPRAMIAGLVGQPGLALKRLVTSGWWVFFGAWLLIPFRSFRAVCGLAPTVLLLGLSKSEAVRSFEGALALPLIGFAFFGVLDVWAVWRALPTVRWREGVVLGAMLSFAVLGAGSASVAPVDFERLRQLQQASGEVKSSPVVCAQTVLVPHLGYRTSLRGLDDLDCMKRLGAVGLVNLGLDTAPHEAEVFRATVDDWRARWPSRELPGGFVIIGPAGVRR